MAGVHFVPLICAQVGGIGVGAFLGGQKFQIEETGDSRFLGLFFDCPGMGNTRGRRSQPARRQEGESGTGVLLTAAAGGGAEESPQPLPKTRVGRKLVHVQEHSLHGQGMAVTSELFLI